MVIHSANPLRGQIFFVQKLLPPPNCPKTFSSTFGNTLFGKLPLVSPHGHHWLCPPIVDNWIGCPTIGVGVKRAGSKNCERWAACSATPRAEEN